MVEIKSAAPVRKCLAFRVGPGGLPVPIPECNETNCIHSCILPEGHGCDHACNCRGRSLQFFRVSLFWRLWKRLFPNRYRKGFLEPTERLPIRTYDF